MQVLHIQRRPALGQVSIERLFTHLRAAFPPTIQCRIHTSPHLSQGLLPRLRNLQAVREESAEIYHITGDVHYLALGLNPRRTVLTIHDCASFMRLKGWKREVLRWIWYKLPMSRACLVTAISEATRQELVRFAGCEASRIRVIHNCVGPEFTPFPKPHLPKRPVLLQVGTAANKNLERVALALTGLQVHLKIVGRLSPTQRELLEANAISYSNLPQATGDEIVAAYREADALVFASLYEGFGLPILEAQATGRPVITSRILSMPEVAGEAACFVDPLDPAAIRRGVLQILSDAGYREQLINRGYENVKRFSPKAIAHQYASLYEEIAQAHG